MMAKAKLWVVTLNARKKKKVGFSPLNGVESWKALKKVKGITISILGRKLDMKRHHMESTF